MQKIKRLLGGLSLILLGLTGSLLFSVKSSAGSLADSPYVEFSPDGKAFTTNPADQDYEWYEEGTTVSTGIGSSIRALETGEHYYKYEREGKLPVGKWQVAHKTATCCHYNGIPEGAPYHDLEFGRQHCLKAYYSGWFAYCADCEELIYPFYIYMSKKAAATIGELDTELDYYYLCPFCTNLEQGTGISGHFCKGISWNRYQVIYDSNTTDWVGGYMENSLHMYNNEQVYEGKEVTPSGRLSKNTYTRIGYEFQGWNTMPDGSGQEYADQAEILNLTTENYDETGKGTVTLYAQWKRSESTLQIDPAGGTYRGKNEITAIVGLYGEAYELKASELTAPQGYTVTFQTLGGQAIAPVVNQMAFTEWILSQPLSGKYRDGVYYFTGTTGTQDRVTASYHHQPIVLPEPVKTGSSFGGWYYDQECTVWAGKAGEQLIPAKDTTLYAKWVDLLLQAENNYAVSGGVGAVDLTWAQNDGNQKAYMIYQSKNQADWSLLSSTEDMGSSKTVERTFSYSGMSQTYTVPYTGVYSLTLNGAQGNGYASYLGGYGGRVTGRVWLEKGEKLTYIIGGQNGYNGGGTGNTFANGGGYTIVTSDKKGTLMIAGGGGGATSFSNGGQGGSSASNVASGTTGEGGASGGGGGYLGGTAGQLVRHYHSASCYTQVDTSSTVMSNASHLNAWAQEFSQLNYGFYFSGGYYADTKSIWGIRAHTTGDEPAIANLLLGEYFDSNYVLQKKLIPVEGGQTLNIHISAKAWGDQGLEEGSLTVWDQNNNIIHSQNLNTITRYTDVIETDGDSIDQFKAAFEQRTGGTRGHSSGWYRYAGKVEGDRVTHSLLYWNESVVLPEGTTGVRIAAVSDFGYSLTWMESTIHEISLKGSKTVKTCSYTQDGQIINSSPAYGGSSYMNTQCVADYQMEAGKQAGNGSFAIKSIKIGFQNTQSMKGVPAPDQAAPDQIKADSLQKSALDENTMKLSWKEPADYGTVYYHRAESYLPGATDVLSNSNITKNTLVSGIAGYYYLVDQSTATDVNSSNGSWTDLAEAKIGLQADRQYFHVAAVDKAGNVGKTVHLEIGRMDQEVAWPVWTDQLQITSAHNSVYEAEAEHIYYVRCDGKTPIMLSAAGWITGQASSAYQVNHLQFHMGIAGEDKVVMDIQVPMAEQVQSTVSTYRAAELTKTVTGQSLLKDDTYAVGRRSEECRNLDITHRFVMDSSMNERKMQITPVAGVDFQGELVTSDWELDQQHSIWLIGDNEAPVITGTEAIENMVNAAPENGAWILQFEASDTGSGIRDFYVIITNSDNGGRREYLGSNGKLEIVAEEDDALFQGDFVAEFHALDQVGNENIVVCNGESFALTAYVERILEPHQPVFRCGESGVIHITAYGYADKVEVIFPEELSDRDSSLNKVFGYDGSLYRQEEQYTFMVPLGTPLGEYQIIVNAWKGDKLRTASPIIWTLGADESVLDDIRTRLR